MTSTTSSSANSSVVTISWMPSTIVCVESTTVLYCTPSGNDFARSFISELTCLPTSTALLPGDWLISSKQAGCSWKEAVVL